MDNEKLFEDVCVSTYNQVCDILIYKLNKHVCAIKRSVNSKAQASKKYNYAV